MKHLLQLIYPHIIELITIDSINQSIKCVHVLANLVYMHMTIGQSTITCTARSTDKGNKAGRDYQMPGPTYIYLKNVKEFSRESRYIPPR